MSRQQVHTQFTQFSKSTPDWKQPFNKVAFINTGAVPFTVNLLPVPVGQQLVIELNVGEINVSDFSVVFDAAPGVQQCWVMYTWYEKNQ